MDCSTPGFPVHHQLPELSQTHVHRVGDVIQPSRPLSSPSPPVFNFSQHWCSLTQSCSTLCNPVDCSNLGSSVHGILQARILELVAMPFSRGSSQPRDWTHISYVSCIGRQVLYFLAPPRKLSKSFLMSRLFSSGGQSIGASASASVPPMNIWDWFP